MEREQRLAVAILRVGPDRTIRVLWQGAGDRDAAAEHLRHERRSQQDECERAAARDEQQPGRDGEVADLKSVLKTRLGKEPRLTTKVDPSLLGGLVVKVGSRMIDSSLRTKLDGLRAAMKGN